MNKAGKMCVNYYNYRVEFQMRGAGHVHGTLWIDWKELKMKKKSKINVQLIEKAFENIKHEKFGSEEQTKNEFVEEH